MLYNLYREVYSDDIINNPQLVSAIILMLSLIWFSCRIKITFELLSWPINIVLLSILSSRHDFISLTTLGLANVSSKIMKAGLALSVCLIFCMLCDDHCCLAVSLFFMSGISLWKIAQVCTLGNIHTPFIFNMGTCQWDFILIAALATRIPFSSLKWAGSLGPRDFITPFRVC